MLRFDKGLESGTGLEGGDLSVGTRCTGISRLLAGLLCALAVSGSAVADSFERRFEQLSVAEGLAQSQVLSISQSRDGALWIGTYGGVSRYDGEFTNFGVSQGLASDQVYGVVEDPQGTIWIATLGGGLSRFDDEGFHNYGRSEGLTDTNLLDVIIDHDGRLWLASWESGVFLFDGQTFEAFTVARGLPANAVRDLYEDRTGQIWALTRDGVAIFDGVGFRTPGAEGEAGPQRVLSILEDNRGVMYFGTAGRGLWRFQDSRFSKVPLPDWLETARIWSMLDKGGLLLGTSLGPVRLNGGAVEKLTESAGFPRNGVVSLFEDREGIVWFGTENLGLIKHSENAFSYLDVGTSLSTSVVAAIVQDDRGTTWIGCHAGGLLRVGLHGEGDEVQELRLQSDIQALALDAKQQLWIGTRSEGLCVYDSAKVRCFGRDIRDPELNIHSILIPSGGETIYVGTNRHGVLSFDGRNLVQVSNNPPWQSAVVRTMCVGSDGRIWAGSDAHGLGLVASGGGIAQVLSRKDLDDAGVNALAADQDGALWLGTSRGVFLFEPDTGSATGRLTARFTSNQGLSSDAVKLLTLDGRGRLWVGSQRGVDRVDLPLYRSSGEVSIRHFGPQEGFRGVECVDNAVVRAVDRSLWFGTVDGVVRFEPGKDRVNTIEPKTRIVGLRLFHESRDLEEYYIDESEAGQKILQLPHDLNHLSFDFKGVSLVRPSRVRYQWRLIDFDRDWSPMSSATSATYANLPPGRYVFEVKACNDSGIWNRTPARVVCEIKQDWWKTPWAIAGAIVLVFLAVAGFLFLRTRRFASRTRELREIVDMKTQELKEERDRATQASKTKSIFLATMGHEIRTPLNAIIGGSNLLSDTKLDDHQRELVEMTKTSGNTLLKIIDDILDFTKIEAGKMTIDLEPMNLRTCIREAIAMLQEPIKNKGLDVRIEVDDDAPLRVFGDRTRIRQVLVNLIGNAIKFTHEGSVTVSVEWGASDRVSADGFFSYRLTVTDTGIGIPSERLEEIFESFTQLDASAARRYGGSGLGLAICRRIVEALGGTIYVESEVGTGSSFIVILELKSIPRDAQALTSAAWTPTDILSLAGSDGEHDDGFSSLTVLIAEDEPLNQEVVVALLSKLKCRADVVSSGPEVLEAVQKTNYDVVFMDVQMPGMSGLETTRAIAEAFPEARRPWIVALTAGTMSQDQRACFDAGMNDFIAKPVRLNRLREVLARYLRRRS